MHGLVAGGGGFFPGAGVDWVVLPFLAAAYEVHDEAEDEHEEAPGEVEVDAHGFLVDVSGVAGDEAVDAHKAADEQEDQAEGDADV
jgi:hypothetical protein